MEESKTLWERTAGAVRKVRGLVKKKRRERPGQGGEYGEPAHILANGNRAGPFTRRRIRAAGIVRPECRL